MTNPRSIIGIREDASVVSEDDPDAAYYLPNETKKPSGGSLEPLLWKGPGVALLQSGDMSFPIDLRVRQKEEKE